MLTPDEAKATQQALDALGVPTDLPSRNTNQYVRIGDRWYDIAEIVYALTKPQAAITAESEDLRNYTYEALKERAIHADIDWSGMKKDDLIAALEAAFYDGMDGAAA